jgi:hypothetical protein
LGHERLHHLVASDDGAISSPPAHTIFNRRTAKSLSHRFARVIQQAVLTRPTTYRGMVAAGTT